ncbi:hypothetical protein BO78DRAFT_157824 [Aspergillus sclerotiicarbonarius CBS 121057]|uniref:Uncharacterized protein n=1 Tax=Aspergillus sclerotiicarbonarius (strain CBS 121057 / IBT 28362) TaxID=1448318 RepID=A0A319E9Z3_ASPSB|nr:hypothetical protein BO78DRAFT_157824 [Aspergillus sclerotiicarbonarius CBS 121057]
MGMFLYQSLRNTSTPHNKPPSTVLVNPISPKLRRPRTLVNHPSNSTPYSIAMRYAMIYRQHKRTYHPHQPSTIQYQPTPQPNLPIRHFPQEKHQSSNPSIHPMDRIPHPRKHIP